MNSFKIIIGSRGSDLALWQANYILRKLKEIGIEAKIKTIKTLGDKIQDLSFDKMEGKGFFTKEIEEALLNKNIDLAIHSYKDLETNSPSGLIIAAVSEREDPSDILLIRKDAVDVAQKFSLKKEAIVGTSSARRKTLLLSFRDDIQLKDLRGNVPTRIQKLQDGQYEAILLAAAGVERLGLDLGEFHTEILDPKEFIPAPAQGVLALQIRDNDKELFQTLQKLNDAEVEEIVGIERKVLNLLEGGCQLPLGVYCEKDEEETLYKVWVAKAETWNDIPKRLYFESKKKEEFADRIVEKINNIKPASLYITRDVKRSGFFCRSLAANGYDVVGKSLIAIKQITFKKVPDTDWVFFSSKNAVRHFFSAQGGSVYPSSGVASSGEQNPTGNKVKYAAIGKATATELRRYGKRADFIGYSADTKLTGKQFASATNGGIVLFPQAKGSLRTIQQQFVDPNKVVDRVVYETIQLDDIKIPKTEIVIFTSPSNVNAYFETKKINSEQKVIAIGNATGNALIQFGVKSYKMPNTFDDLGLLHAVFGV